MISGSATRALFCPHLFTKETFDFLVFNMLGIGGFGRPTEKSSPHRKEQASPTPLLRSFMKLKSLRSFSPSQPSRDIAV